MTSGAHLFYSTLREKAPESVFGKADYELELKEMERMKMQRWAGKERDEPGWYKTVTKRKKEQVCVSNPYLTFLTSYQAPIPINSSCRTHRETTQLFPYCFALSPWHHLSEWPKSPNSLHCRQHVLPFTGTGMRFLHLSILFRDIYTDADVHMVWHEKDNLWKLLLSFYYVDSGQQIRVIRLGSKHFYPWSHFVSSVQISCKTWLYN